MDIIKGNIFTSNCQTLVNAVNCVGVMGAGIAYEYRLRYPQMYHRYAELCQQHKMKIGALWLYKNDKKWVLNFPTKNHWKFETKPEYLEKGLQKFMETYKDKGIESIAFPLLGASLGGLSEEISINIMKKYLDECDIPVEIYYFDPMVYDDVYLHFKTIWNSIHEKELATKSGLRIDFVRKVKQALERDDIRSLSRLLGVNGIGEQTLEKSFRFIDTYQEADTQLNLL